MPKEMWEAERLRWEEDKRERIYCFKGISMLEDRRIIKKGGSIFKVLEGLIYVLYVLTGFYLAFLIRFDLNPTSHNIKPFIDSIPYIVLVSLIIFYIYDIVSTLKKSLFENALIITISLILIDIITAAVVFFNRGFSFPRSVFLIGIAIQFVLIFSTKAIILKIIKSNRIVRDVLIIASRQEAEYIAKKILLDKYYLDNIKYICNRISENIHELIDNVDIVYIGSTVNNDDKINLVSYCSEKNKTICLVPNLFEISLVDFKISQVNDLLIFKLEDLGLTHEQRFIKRMIDIIVSSLGLIIVLPVLFIVSIIIKLHDKGPVLYRQKRVTEKNKTFSLYKFRTMIEDAEEHTGPVLATEKDLRITSIGRFLRTSRIDEIPQLINVLKGDMSIVGPRPERPFFAEQFNEEVDEFKYRTFVKAGITGLAQVLGTYSTEPGTKAKYDLLYIKNYSLLLDIKIIFNTLRIIFMKNSSKGTKKERKLEEIFNELDLNVYEELGATKLE